MLLVPVVSAENGKSAGRNRAYCSRCSADLRRACARDSSDHWRLVHLACLQRSNVLGVSCAAGPARLRQSGAAVAANDVRRTEWRTATAVTPSRWRWSRQLGCRAEAGPHRLHTKVRPCIAVVSNW